MSTWGSKSQSFFEVSFTRKKVHTNFEWSGWNYTLRVNGIELSWQPCWQPKRGLKVSSMLYAGREGFSIWTLFGETTLYWGDMFLQYTVQTGD